MKFVYKLSTLLTGVLLGVLVSLIASKLIEKKLLKSQMMLSALETDPVVGLQDSIDDERKKVSSAILIDSILTIVQNYYVDRERSLDNRNLVIGALKELSHYQGVSIRFNDSDVIIQVDDMVYNFTLEEQYSFPRLLEDSIQISLFFEKTKLKDRLFPDRMNYIGEDFGSFVYLNALLHSLDPHSSLLDQEEYRELRQGTEGSFGGLGIVVGIQDDILTVIKPLPHSPAAKAGISVKDKITFINNTSTFGTSLQSLVHHMRGAPGTEVDLSLLRSGEVAPREIKITREVIQVSSISSEILEADSHKVLKISIDSFSSHTSEEIVREINKNITENPIQGIILDLRGNPGGLLDQSVKVADTFLKQGRIVSTSGRRPEVEIAYDEGTEFQYPMVVLVDDETASASEILAGALQDNDRAIILGQPTFGKGSVQTVFELPTNLALKLTIARYYSPNGKTIQNAGIIPDIWLQPVNRQEENSNLLGSGRYVSERFLSNRLSGSTVANLPHSRYKYFYMKDDDVDFEEKLALGVMQNLIEKNGYPLPEDRQRATYWLANTSDFLRDTLQPEEEKVVKYFKNHHKFYWSDTKNSLPQEKPPKVKLSLGVDKVLEVKEGQEILIPWSLENFEANSLSKISVFVRSYDGVIEPLEVVVGVIEAGGRVSGKIPVKISFPSGNSLYRFFVGYSIGGWPIVSKQQAFSFKVLPSKRPNIAFDLEIIEEIGGKEDGVLEPGERAILQVNLHNNSKIMAHKVSAELVSLSGKQISLGTLMSNQELTLDEGQDHKIKFPIDVSNDLKSKGLHFGLTINAEEYLQPMKKSYFLKAIPKRR